MKERDHIERRITEATTELAAAEQSAGRLSWARLGYFVAAVAVLLAIRPVSSWSILIAAIPFAVLVRLHRQASKRVERASGSLAAARGSLARMDRDWPNIPPLQTVDVSAMPNRAAIRDLDLYGERSLFRLLDVAQPRLGGTVVLNWLLDDPASLASIHARQQSVRELREQPDFLLECARLCRHGSRPGPNGAKLLAFRGWCAQTEDRFSAKLVWIARILTGAFLLMLATIGARPALLQPLAATLMFLLAGQFVVAGLARKYLHARVREASDLLSELNGVVDVLHAIEGNTGVTGRFGVIRQSLVSNGASAGIRQLTRLFGWNGVQHSPMLLAFVNGLVAFDAHLASRIDDWRQTFGARLPEWIDLVAEAQAIIALATLAYENPQWAMATVHDDASPIVAAKDCGHPLVANERRITNPVSIDRPASAIIVSGSNMSGKTTYLRAVGVNALLAFAGGPVCASELTVRRSRVRTTVRIEDDLNAGVSLFMAEVSRIAAVVTDASQDPKTPVLFLFDEILHGTNAQDRREATQLVLERLLGSGASGIVTTHDPRIADVVDRTGDMAVTQVHFTDALETRDGKVTMTFDYVLRPGPATTTNALRILQPLLSSRA